MSMVSSLARSVWRDGNRRIADARACMSVYRRISDPVQSNAECTLMTQNRYSREGVTVAVHPTVAEELVTMREPVSS